MLIFAIAVEQTDPADRAAYLDGAGEGDIVLQAWFGQDKELAATRQRTLAIAIGTNDANVAERTAKSV